MQIQSTQTTPSYSVAAGDTLGAIASRFGTTVDAMLQANPQITDQDLIFQNDTLALPGSVAGETSTAASPSELSQNGVDLIKSFEGLRLNSYQDSGGVWTIGYGHTSGVGQGQTITRAQAESFLRQDVQWAENAVREQVDAPLSQNQFDALVSFTFNVGAGAFERSTLLSRLNAGDYAGAQQEFGRWVHADGQRLEGLVRRRGDEAALFGSDAPAVVATPPDPATSGYTVRSGDTMSSIAAANGVSLEALIAANGQISNPNLIMPGEQITLPVGDAPPATTNYTVKPGDTLSGIALATSVDLDQLLTLNPQISNVNLIYPGQVLTVPGTATVTPPVVVEPTPPAEGTAQYAPYTVYSTGDRAAFAVSDATQLQAHHDYQTRNRDGQILEVRDVVLHRPGESQTTQAIPAPVAGEVIQAGPNGGAGNSVILRSESGQLVYIFHMSSIDVRVGQQVSYGQDLGNQGSTGNSTGPHVHIEAPDAVVDRWVNDLLDGTFDGVDSL